METALSDLTALMLKLQANGDKAAAEEFERNFATRGADYDADRLQLGIENIPADIRFEFKR